MSQPFLYVYSSRQAFQRHALGSVISTKIFLPEPSFVHILCVFNQLMLQPQCVQTVRVIISMFYMLDLPHATNTDKVHARGVLYIR